MVKITGLDKLTKTLDQAQKALAEVGDELGTVSFDPHDPASIEAAIQSMENMVDLRLGDYASNPVIAPLIEGMKEQYRQGIIDRAAEVRLQGGGRWPVIFSKRSTTRSWICRLRSTRPTSAR